MNEKRRVETVEEFKLRTRADAPRPDPLLVPSEKPATYRKAKRRKTR